MIEKPHLRLAKRKIELLVLINILLVYFLASATPSQALDPTKFSVSSSETISTVNSNGILKIYLSTFKPNETVNFRIHSDNTDTVTLVSGSDKLALPAAQSFHFSIVSGSLLAASALFKPIKEFKNQSGAVVIQIFPAPSDIPVISTSGDTSLINKREILSTPVVADGSYVIDSIGTSIKFFARSDKNLIGFRKLSDSPITDGLGGVPVYGFLEQKDFDVTATSLGTWTILDSHFQTVEQINQIQTKFGTMMPEGHDIAVAPSGNVVVITTPTRSVDSSWLKRGYKLPILDCNIAEIVNGKAINQFSFWDWAVANKAVSEPLIDAMPLFNDPQNPNSPIDICHANSLQYFKATNQYLISLRSPSILMILSPNLKTVKSIIPTDGSLQHFAKFVSAKEITALGNFSLDKFSKFMDFKLVNGAWTLKETPLPVHVQYCGNTQFIDATHIWLGGGCGAFSPATLGAVYKISGGAFLQSGVLKMTVFNYSYRADLLP